MASQRPLAVVLYAIYQMEIGTSDNIMLIIKINVKTTERFIKITTRGLILKIDLNITDRFKDTATSWLIFKVGCRTFGPLTNGPLTYGVFANRPLTNGPNKLGLRTKGPKKEKI